jgi:hypothetical protein
VCFYTQQLCLHKQQQCWLTVSMTQYSTLSLCCLAMARISGVSACTMLMPAGQAQALGTVKLQLLCLVLQQFDACRLLRVCNGAAAAAAAWPMQL